MSDKNIISPNSVTDSTGKEVMSNTVPRGTVVGDGTNNRVLLGFQKDGFGTGLDYGLKVSKAGFDVATATAAQLIFNSSQDVFKIVSSGTASIVISSTGEHSYEVQVAHGLAYIPLAIAFVLDPTQSTYNAMPYNITTIASSPFSFVASILSAALFVNSTYLSFTIETTSSQDPRGTWTFKYYILQETAN